ncbi:MAG: hypothetical protein KGL16_01490 [Acidobacteriota bacterium]|nr:hypothetical protein [Acidobacteriota bacterium]
MSICNVLAVLGEREDAMWRTLHAAVALAEAERARLTLVKTCESGRTYVWIAPFAVGGAYVPPLDSPAEAAKLLAHVAEAVPDEIPVTSFVLGPDTQNALLKLVRAGHYGAVVADADLLKHCRRLRRQLRRDEISVLGVSGQAEAVELDPQIAEVTGRRGNARMRPTPTHITL